MTHYFSDFDFTNFWVDDNYALENYVEAKPSDELIESIEQELGYKLPAAYIELMKLHNGGVPADTCFKLKKKKNKKPWESDFITIDGIMGIGRDKKRSLCGEYGSVFMNKTWKYSKTGICICTTPSGGHEMVMLEYKKCGPTGEPQVVYVDVTLGKSTKVLAEDFETFIKGLVNESTVIEPPKDDDLIDLFAGNNSAKQLEIINSD